jgi:hypothetical protein
VLRAAQEAYVQGMSDVLVVVAGLMAVGSALMVIFLPARATRPEPEVAGELR